MAFLFRNLVGAVLFFTLGCASVPKKDTIAYMQEACNELEDKFDIRDPDGDRKVIDCTAYMTYVNYNTQSRQALVGLNIGYAFMVALDRKDFTVDLRVLNRVYQGSLPIEQVTCRLLQDGILKQIRDLEARLAREERAVELQHPRIMALPEYVPRKRYFHNQIGELRRRVNDYKCGNGTQI